MKAIKAINRPYLSGKVLETLRSLAMNKAPLLLGAICMAIVVASGCVPRGQNLVAAGTVSVDRQSEGRIRVSSVDVYQDDETLIVEGSLSRWAGFKARSMGHVDVVVVDPDGKVLAQKNFPDIWPNCHGNSFFTTEMPLIAPKGATVRAIYHDSRVVPALGHTDSELLDLYGRVAKR
jgi:hypothetical protein